MQRNLPETQSTVSDRSSSFLQWLIPAVTVPPGHGRGWAACFLAVGRAQHRLPGLLPALAFQDGCPVVGPGAQALARGRQLDVPVVAAGEQDVLPARVRLRACAKGGKAGITWNQLPSQQPTMEMLFKLWMVSLSSNSRSAATTVLSRVRIIRSTNAGPKCFSTHLYFSTMQCSYFWRGLVQMKTSVLKRNSLC